MTPSSCHASAAPPRAPAVTPLASQLGLFGAPPDPAIEALREALAALDVDALRPLEALNLLAEWKRKLPP